MDRPNTSKEQQIAITPVLFILLFSLNVGDSFGQKLISFRPENRLDARRLDSARPPSNLTTILTPSRGFWCATFFFTLRLPTHPLLKKKPDCRSSPGNPAISKRPVAFRP